LKGRPKRRHGPRGSTLSIKTLLPVTCFGDPIENIRLVEDPDRTFRVTMKDGKIFKNTLPDC